ncbi:hypothetical protein B0J13DRAFT_423117, partial [Dactylonectria estremocensis]
MHLKPPCRPPPPAPQCRTIIIRHPQYSVHDNTLIRFPALDAATSQDRDDSRFDCGIHHLTALAACQIIAGNAAYLSCDRHSEYPVELDYNGILTKSQYYLQVPQGVYDISPYPIICDFEDWQFPHGGLPGAWARLNQTLSEIKSPSSGCFMTSFPTKDIAHLIPQASTSWFRRNRMGDYLTNPRGAFGPDNEANVCRLRGDLLKDFDELAFAFVPKFTRRGCRLVAHYLSAADDLICPASMFHNQMTNPLDKIAPEFLLARFAYAVFGLLHGFTAQTERRLAIAEPGEDELGLCAWVHNVYTMTSAEVAAR